MFDEPIVKLYVCVECESEYTIKTHFSDGAVSVCPFCAAPLPAVDEE